MEKRMMNKRLTHAIDTCMSGIQIDPFLCRKIVRNETRSKNRKMPLATITAIILIAVASNNKTDCFIFNFFANTSFVFLFSCLFHK